VVRRCQPNRLLRDSRDGAALAVPVMGRRIRLMAGLKLASCRSLYTVIGRNVCFAISSRNMLRLPFYSLLLIFFFLKQKLFFPIHLRHTR